MQLSKNVQQTMTSLSLRELVNESRQEHGESKVRNTTFLDRVEDELSGELPVAEYMQPRQGGTPQRYYVLTRDQCMLIGMRESKAVRRTVLEKLKMAERGQPLTNVAATMALVECAASLLNASDSGKVVMLRKAGQAIGADTGFLPDYTEDSAPGHVGAMDTASATQLLRDHGVTMGAAKFNQVLASIGIIERRHRKDRVGNTKGFWCITETGLDYGKNIVSPQSPRETQPHYYRETFTDLLAIVGVEGVRA